MNFAPSAETRPQTAVAVQGPGNGASSIWNSDDDVAGVRVVADDLDRADRVVATSRATAGMPIVAGNVTVSG